MKPKENEPILTFDSQADFEQWLEENHASTERMWVKYPKKGSGIPSLTYEEAVIAALCYGWIDGQASGLDETYWLQSFTPRRPKSKWSKINRTRAEKLIAEGKMRPAGLRQVERAQADGRWAAAYDSSSTITVPDDLQAALEESPEALRAFEALNSQNRYAILYRIQDAKRPETRAGRIRKFVAMLNEGKKIY